MDPETEILREQQAQLTGRAMSQKTAQGLYTALMRSQALPGCGAASECACTNKNLLGRACGNPIRVASSLAADYLSVSDAFVSYPRTTLSRFDPSAGSRSIEGEREAIPDLGLPQSGGIYPPANPFQAANWRDTGKVTAVATGPRIQTFNRSVRQFAGIPKGKGNTCPSRVEPLPDVKVREILPCHKEKKYSVQRTQPALPNPTLVDLAGLSQGRKKVLESWVSVQDDVWPDMGTMLASDQDEANPSLYSRNPGAFVDQQEVRELTLSLANNDHDSFKVTRTQSFTHRNVVPFPSGELFPVLAQVEDAAVISQELEQRA